eukprot:9379477-Ditylum_brightwellii.AAC.1
MDLLEAKLEASNVSVDKCFDEMLTMMNTFMEGHRTHQTTISSIQARQVFIQGQHKWQKHGLDDSMFSNDIIDADGLCTESA